MRSLPSSRRLGNSESMKLSFYESEDSEYGGDAGDGYSSASISFDDDEIVSGLDQPTGELRQSMM